MGEPNGSPRSRGSGSGADFDPRGVKWLLIPAVIALVLMLFMFASGRWGGQKQEKLDWNAFLTKLDSGEIKTVGVSKRTYRGDYREGGKFSGYICSTGPAIDDNPQLQLLIRSKVETFNIEEPPLWQGMLLQVAAWMLIILIVYYLFFRRLGSAGGPGGVLAFGKSRAKLADKSKNRKTFEDVAGVDESKEEVQEIINFLKDPKRFQKLGGRIPKGVLLVGPPGCGKTLLAKAIAGEANVPFFSISGSDFVEMFVGVGASRVRDLFQQAKESSPCIVFLDEIDAVGRMRGTGLGGGHDEREQTLNAILVEMDGFDSDEQVIVIAATNRPDVLDPALLRPGRFDRHIVIDLPDIRGRKEILKVHAGRIKLGDGTDFDRLARATPSFTGADLENMVNEAALIAVMRGRDAVGMPELEEARDKVLWGKEKRSKVMSEEDRIVIAYHESGHALASHLLPEVDPLHKVTILPRGMALGATMHLPERDQYTKSRRKLLGEVKALYAGRVAEEMFLGDISTGAQNDIEHATSIIRKMVCRFGMSDRLGPLSYGTDQDHIFLGHELGRMREYSEETGHEIDQEVRLIAAECYKAAKDLVTAHRDDVKRIADELLRREVLSAEDVDGLLGKKQQEGGSGSAPSTEAGGADRGAPAASMDDGTPRAAGSHEGQP